MVGKYEMLIPVYGNDGAGFTADTVQAFEDFCADRFGGFTHNPTVMRGVWIDDDGTRYDDLMTAYYLFAEHEIDIYEAAQVAAVLFEQLAISVVKPGGVAEIIRNATVLQPAA